MNNAELIERVYPLSPIQEGILYHYLENQHMDYYFQQIVFTVTGELDINCFQNSINIAMDKHDILRNIFVYEEMEQLYQVCIRDRELTLTYLDLSQEPEDDIPLKVKEIAHRDKEMGFDLSKDILMRYTVVRTNEYKHKVIWSFHHIIVDGWSLNLLNDEIFNNYRVLKAGESLASSRGTSFYEYVDWLQKQDKTLALDYWKNLLSDYTAVSPLFNISGSASNTFIYRNFKLIIEGEKFSKLCLISKQYDTTINNILQSLWGVYLQKVSNADDVVFGSVVTVRPPQVRDINRLIGPCINTIPVRVKSEDGSTFVDLFQSVQRSFLESQKFTYCSISEILRNHTKYGGNSIIDHIFTFENYPIDFESLSSSSNSTDLQIGDIEVCELTNYGFNLVVVPQNEAVVINFYFNEESISIESVSRMSDLFENLITNALNEPNKKIADTPLASDEERRKLSQFGTGLPLVVEVDSIVKIFEKSVLDYPNKICLSYKDQGYTYKNLNDKSNRLARHLLENGLTKSSVIGVLTDNQLDAVICFMAILKAGGVFLPLNAQSPIERLQHIVTDCSPSMILCSRTTASVGAGIGLPIIDIEVPEIDHQFCHNLNVCVSPNDPIYILYTSGTTGGPKGVMVSMENLVNANAGWRTTFKLDSFEVKLLSISRPEFDVFIADICRSILNNGELVIATESERMDLEALYQLIIKYQINVLDGTPAIMVPLMDYIYKANNGHSLDLRVVVIGSDACLLRDFRRIKENFPYIRYLVNCYGVTEGTIDSSYFHQENLYLLEDKMQMTPIGKPFPNVHLFVLDKYLNVQPIGIIGEIYIGGIGVTKGYVGNDELNQQKFVKTPYDSGYMYRTGDLGRWLWDGNLEWVGRSDNQVKIRGFRIELNEVENQLSQHPDVRQAIAVVRNLSRNNTKVICCYVALNHREKQLDSREVIAYLRTRLPNYMLPAQIIVVEEFLLNSNGKIDKNNLPKPEIEVNTEVEAFSLSSKETVLTEVWEAVLGVGNLKTTDNFFDLGGDSITAIMICSKLQQYNYKTSVKDIFEFPTIRELALVVRSRTAQEEQETVGIVPLTPIQKWFFSENFIKPSHWNQSLVLFRKKGFSLEIVKQTFQEIVKHHDVLRATYEIKANEFGQFLRTSGEDNLFIVERFQISSEARIEEVISTEANRQQGLINIFAGQTIRLCIFETMEGDYLLIILHHLIIDGVSWRILLEDFFMVHQLLTADKEVHLPEKTNSYKTWAQHLVEYSRSETLLGEAEYWNSVILKSNYPLIVRKDSFNYDTSISGSQFELTVEQTAALLYEVNKAYNTEVNDILLTALLLSIADLTGQRNVVFELESHGRQEEIANNLDVSRTVGWFTYTYPVFLEFNKSAHIGEIIKSVKEQLRSVPNKGIGYGVLKYHTAYLSHYKHKPEILFNYLGTVESGRGESDIEISEVSSGLVSNAQNHKPQAIEINCIIVNGTFRWNITYDSDRFNANTISSITAKYKESLASILQHCISRNETEYTPSDFSAKSLNEEDLRYALDYVQNLED